MWSSDFVQSNNNWKPFEFAIDATKFKGYLNDNESSSTTGTSEQLYDDALGLSVVVNNYDHNLAGDNRHLGIRNGEALNYSISGNSGTKISDPITQIRFGSSFYDNWQKLPFNGEIGDFIFTRRKLSQSANRGSF